MPISPADMKKSHSVVFFFVIVFSIASGTLVVVFQSELVNFLRGKAIIGYVGLILSLATLILVLRINALRAYPLLRICLIPWPCLGTILAGAALIVDAYASPRYSDAVLILALAMVGLWLTHIVILPFAILQVFRKHRSGSRGTEPG